MLNIFKRHKPSNKIAKLYALNISMDEREKVVASVLNYFSKFFDEKLTEFDIHGPYGISKGKSVGYKAFTNKLQKKGHSKYSSINGKNKENFGFHINYLIDDSTLEIIIWYKECLYQINLFELAQSLSKNINIQYGFVFSLPINYCVSWESKIKKSFGSISISTNLEAQNWQSKVHAIQQGKIRNLYQANIINESQVKHFNTKEFKTTSLSGKLDYVQQINSAPNNAPWQFELPPL
jgi:hypothetical protein